MSEPEKTGGEQTGRFRKGRSGNPSGRPKGARNRATLAVEALLDGEAETLTRKAIEMALAGDGPAMRLCLERIAPPRKDRVITFTLPPIESVADARAAMASLVTAVSEGELTPGEANELAKLIEGYIGSVQATEFAERLEKLEGMLK